MHNNHAPFSLTSDKISQVLEECRRIAVYGLSDEPGRQSFEICKFLSVEGFEVIPIGLPGKTGLHVKSYAKLSTVPGEVDMILVFPGTDPAQTAAEALRWKVPVVWFQRGVKAKEAAEELFEKGVKVVYNRCVRLEYLTRWPPVASLYTDVGSAD